MPRPSWKEELHRRLERPGKARARPRLAVVGVGSEMRGDDVAGVLAARALMPLGGGSLLVLDAGPAPENVTGALHRFEPDFILLIDAADVGEAPGAVCWIEGQEAEGISGATHSLPLSMLARYLTEELGCEVALLGIQPHTISLLTAAPSPEVRQAVEDITEAISALYTDPT